MLKAPPYLQQARFEDGLVLLDLRRGEFLMLDDVAAAMWSGLSSQVSESSLRKALAEQFDVEESRLAEDIGAFRQRCIAGGLLVVATRDEGLPAAPRRPLRKISFPALAAWVCLISTAIRLRSFGFADTYQAIVARAPETAPKCDESHLARAETAFARAENFFVARAAPDDCLPRSLALFKFLRRLGLPAEHHIGFERFSSSAHAWVECGGRVILDVDRRASLTKLSAVAT